MVNSQHIQVHCFIDHVTYGSMMSIAYNYLLRCVEGRHVQNFSCLTTIQNEKLHHKECGSMHYLP